MSPYRHNSLPFRLRILAAVIYDAAERAYDRHSDFIHGMAAGAVYALGLAWLAYEVFK